MNDHKWLKSDTKTAEPLSVPEEKRIDEPLYILMYIRSIGVLRHHFRFVTNEDILSILNSRFRRWLACVPIDLLCSEEEIYKNAELFNQLEILDKMIRCYCPKTKNEYH